MAGSSYDRLWMGSWGRGMMHGYQLGIFSVMTRHHQSCTTREENHCCTEVKFFSEHRPINELEDYHQNAAQKHDDATNKLFLFGFATNHHLPRFKVHLFPRSKLNVVGRTCLYPSLGSLSLMSGKSFLICRISHSPPPPSAPVYPMYLSSSKQPAP